MARRASVSAAPLQAISGLLKELKAVEEDAELVDKLMDAMAEIVDGATLRKTAVSWFDEHGVGEDEDKKFGDGIANASEATPEMLTDVQFYTSDYTPDITSGQLVHNVSTWFTPTHVIWDRPTMEDLQGNCDLMMQHHHCGKPEFVIPFLLYSVSQKGLRYVWAVWAVPKDDSKPAAWRSVKSTEMEAAFQDCGPTKRFELDPTWFPKKLGVVSDRVPVGDVAFENIAPDGCGADFHCHASPHFVLLRYSLTQRGNPAVSPLHDTILWLPRPAPAADHIPAVGSHLRVLPPAGILEYLYSREASEAVEWAADSGGWTVCYALGEAAALLVRKCFAEPNQQDYNAALHAEVTALVDAIVDDNSAAHETIGNALASWALLQGHSVAVPPLAGSSVRPLLRQIVASKLSGMEKPAPANLAHALEVQALLHKGTTYLVAVSGMNPTVSSKDGAVHMLARLTNLHDDQIFWQLNRAMRMKQFGVEPHLQVDAKAGPDVGGKYFLTAPPPKRFEDGPPALRSATHTCHYKQKAWAVQMPTKKGGLVDRPLHPRNTWFELGTWLLPQSKPLQYYLDKALDDASLIRGSKAPPGLVTYRGLKEVTLDRAIYDTGKIVLWGAYSSTSGDRGIASAFAQGDGKAAVFSLEGSKCVCISKWSRFGREREWLYPPNSSFKVTSALSEEHAELAGKKDLQIFSMAEVDEIEALIVYLRGLVNRVVSSAQGAPAEEAALMPQHVEQLFRVILALSDYKVGDNVADLNTALSATCNPAALMLYTPEGAGLARKLLSMGASQFVLSKIGREVIGPLPEKLIRLVASGAPFTGSTGALGWMGEFEAEGRAWMLESNALQRACVKDGRQLFLEESEAFALLLRCHADYASSGNAEALQVSGMSGAKRHLNGTYIWDKQAVRFTQCSPPRFGCFSEIAFDPDLGDMGLWVLADSEMRAEAHNPAAWVPRSAVLSGDWKETLFTALPDTYGFPFVEALAQHPHDVLYVMPPDHKTHLEEATTIAESCDSGDAKFLKEAVEKLKRRPSHSVTTASDRNLLPVPDAYHDASIETDKEKKVALKNHKDDNARKRFSIGFGFGFEDSWRCAAVKPLSLSALNVMRDKTRMSESSSFEKPNIRLHLHMGTPLLHPYSGMVDPKHSLLGPQAPPQRTYEKERCVMPKFINAQRKGQEALDEASANVTQEEVTRKVTWQRVKILARQAAALAPDTTPPPVPQLLLKEDPEAALEEYITQLKEELKAKVVHLAFDMRVKCLPETVPELKLKPSLSCKPCNGRSRAARARRQSTRAQQEETASHTHTALGVSKGTVNLHIGQAGCQIGAACWELLCLDHGILPDATRPVSDGFGDPACLFQEVSGGRWRPRAVFADMEPKLPMTALRGYGLGDLVEPGNIVEGNNDCSDCYAYGYSWSGAKTTQNEALEQIRRQTEACDKFQGVQITHSVCGGCGSGFFANVVEKMRTSFGVRTMLVSHTVMPSPKVQSNVSATMNWLLANRTLVEMIDMCTLYDNESLYNATMTRMGLTDPNFTDMNRLIAQVYSSYTATTRLPSVIGTDLVAMSANLIPYPRLNYLVPALAPLMSERSLVSFSKSRTRGVGQLTSSAMHPSSLLFSLDSGKAISCQLNFRGDVGPLDLMTVMHGVRQKYHSALTKHVLCSGNIVSQPPVASKAGSLLATDTSLTMLLNSTAAGEMQKSLFKQATVMYQKRAFVHHYVGAGMEEGQFSESFEDTWASIQDYEMAAEENENEGEEEEDDDY